MLLIHHVCVIHYFLLTNLDVFCNQTLCLIEYLAIPIVLDFFILLVTCKVSQRRNDTVFRKRMP